MNLKTTTQSTTARNNANSILSVIDKEADGLVRQAHGQMTPNLYVQGATCKMTKERAFAQMLEENPDVYEAYRAAHDAAPLLAKLERAGIRLQ